jgi:hypothetical protein
MDSTGGMILTGINWSTERKTCHSATFPTTNPTWYDLGSNLSLQGTCPVATMVSPPQTQDCHYVFCCPKQTNVYQHPPCLIFIHTDLEYMCLLCLYHSCNVHISHFFIFWWVLKSKEKKKMAKMSPQACACFAGDYSHPVRLYKTESWNG